MIRWSVHSGAFASLPVLFSIQAEAYCIIFSILDLVWSDPEDVDTWAVSPRGAGWLFGAKVTYEVHN